MRATRGGFSQHRECVAVPHPHRRLGEESAWDKATGKLFRDLLITAPPLAARFATGRSTYGKRGEGE
jgi:hypothetical protein